ncbi:MAG: hypothetical protein VW169_03140 [Rhodospirillaceae bacterium]|jgi:hypothetical protein
MSRRILFVLFAIGILLPVLGACGKKNAPSAPEGEEYKYPREYPRK